MVFQPFMITSQYWLLLFFKNRLPHFAYDVTGVLNFSLFLPEYLFISSYNISSKLIYLKRETTKTTIRYIVSWQPLIYKME